LLEAKSTAHDRLAEELAAQHQKTVALRREVSELEAKNQSLENAATATRYREQSLQQEVDLLKRNLEWHEGELKTRSQEQTKFRKEKNARIAELERANEDATQTAAALRKTETQLKSRLEELNSKFEDSLQRVQQLQESASKAEESFRAELEGARRLAELQRPAESGYNKSMTTSNASRTKLPMRLASCRRNAKPSTASARQLKLGSQSWNLKSRNFKETWRQRSTPPPLLALHVAMALTTSALQAAPARRCSLPALHG
jgi:chromosome segregation ATPase